MAHSTEYLKRRGNKWWLKLPIPKDLRRFYLSTNSKPREHVEVTLGTSDIAAANRKKHALIAYWQKDFDAKRQEHAGELPSHMAEALRIREHLRAYGAEDADEVAPDPIADYASDLDQRGKSAEALEFHALATAKETLREAWQKWQAQSRRTNATRAKDKQAFEGLLTFLGTKDALAEHVTRARARAYVAWLNENAPNARSPGKPLSYATKQGLIAPLRRFWDDYLDHNEIVPAGTNPWRAPKFTGAPSSTAPNPDAKRAYVDAEILALVNGPEVRTTTHVKYPKRTLMELYALLFYTGARLGEIANLRLDDVDARKGGGYVIHVRAAKTHAGIRRIPVVHPIPVAVLRARIGKRKDLKTQLFAEFIPGGTGRSLGHYPSKALGYYRNRVGLGTATDTHGARHTFITHMKNNLGSDPAHVDQYVGHKLGGMAGRYVHATEEMLVAVAKRIRYAPPIERAFVKALGI